MHLDPKNAMILSFRGTLSCAFGFFCLKLLLFILFMRTCSVSFGIIISMTFMHTLAFQYSALFFLHSASNQGCCCCFFFFFFFAFLLLLLLLLFVCLFLFLLLLFLLFCFLSPVFLALFYFAFILFHTGLALVHIQSNSCICH